ncbi:MAG: CBS domain-containing protein [Oceanicoccus sp.]
MFYIIAQGARISTPIDQLLKSTNVQPVVATTAVKAVTTNSGAIQEKSLSPKAEIYRQSQRKDSESSARTSARFAREIMTSPVTTASVHLSLTDTWQLLAAKGFHHLPIVDDRQQLQGIVSDRDLLRYAANDNRRIGDYPIEQLMTRQVISADANAEVRMLAEIMCSRAIGSIPIVGDDREVIGIVSRTDILRSLVHGAPMELWV